MEYEEQAYYENIEAEEYYAEEMEPEEYYAEELEQEQAYYAAYNEYADEADVSNDRIRYAKGTDEKQNFFARLCSYFRNMGTMDRVVVGSGILVLIMALVTGGVYFSTQQTKKQVSAFADVGTQLENIEMIGEKGLLAVADAQKAKQAAAAAC